jgi:TatD DNase family protein
MPLVHGELPALDAHAHLDDALAPPAFAASGFVLAQTMSLGQAERALGRRDPTVVWAVGCHPRFVAAQEAFATDGIERLIAATPVIGEVGLDSGSRVPIQTQLHTFREILDRARAAPRIVSIHSFHSTSEMLDELERRPLVGAILHWWTGRAYETRRAVGLGCYFSIHAAVARRSIFRRHVPIDRVLIESDLGEKDPPAAIPLRVGWVEQLVAQQYGVSATEVREASWRNLACLAEITHTANLFPPAFYTALTRRSDHA